MSKISPLVRTILIYVMSSSIVPGLVNAAIGMVFSGGQPIEIVRNSLAISGIGFLFAVCVVGIMKILGNHKFWHLLPCALICFVVAPYFIINHDVGFSFYVVSGLPFLLLTAVSGWATTRNFSDQK